MNIEKKAAISRRRKQHNLDRKQAAAIKAIGIVEYPMDLPSLYHAVFDYPRPRRIRFLSTGYDWLDKKHRVADSAMTEVRALRTYILEHLKPTT